MQARLVKFVSRHEKGRESDGKCSAEKANDPKSKDGKQRNGDRGMKHKPPIIFILSPDE